MQFKIDNWVQMLGSEDKTIYQVIDILPNDVIDIGDTIVDKYDIKLWEPKPNEWCWFWNNDNQPFLAQFEEMDDDQYVTKQGLHGSYADLSDATFSFRFCEPFIGQLPTNLKDNK